MIFEIYVHYMYSFTGRKPGRHHFNQVLPVNTSINRTNKNGEPPARCSETTSPPPGHPHQGLIPRSCLWVKLDQPKLHSSRPSSGVSSSSKWREDGGNATCDSGLDSFAAEGMTGILGETWVASKDALVEMMLRLHTRTPLFVKDRH